MADTETERQYKQAFIARVAEARVSRGFKQWQMAEALGIPQDKYKQYEGRSLMPHHMIGRFALICRVDLDWLLTGRGKKPLKQLEIVPSEEPAPRPRRRVRRKNVA